MQKFILQNRLLLPLCRGQKGVKKYGYSHGRILKNYTQPGRETLTDVESEHTLFGNIGLFDQMLFSHYYQIEKIFARKNNFFAAIVGLLCQFLKKSYFLSVTKWFYLKNKPG